jgi:hypothetical protein
MQIEHIPLQFVNMWVQVHDLPMGLMKESVGIRLANHIGAFLEYDKNNNSSFWRQHMRIRVKIDVRLPLKKDTKVMNKAGQWCTVKFKYEKLGIFCFVCGIMGHAENKCEVRFAMEQDDGVRKWSADIRADVRRQGGRLSSRWLREEKNGRPETGGSSSAGQFIPAVINSGERHVDAELVDQHTFHNSHNSNYLPIMSPINNLAHMTNQPTISQNVTDALIIPKNVVSNTTFNTPLNSVTHPLTLHNSSNIPFMSSNKIPLGFQANQSSIINNQSLPITITQPKNAALISQSLNHNAMSFSSQPSTRAQKQTKQPSQKITRVHKSVSNRTRIKPVQNPTRPSPEKKNQVL